MRVGVKSFLGLCALGVAGVVAVVNWKSEAERLAEELAQSRDRVLALENALNSERTTSGNLRQEVAVLKTTNAELVRKASSQSNAVKS